MTNDCKIVKYSELMKDLHLRVVHFFLLTMSVSDDLENNLYPHPVNLQGMFKDSYRLFV